MYCFIPSWYESGDAWNTHYAPWDHAGNSFEFDDTVNQIRMFRDAGEEVELICLGYAPNLRRFLHQQNIYPFLYYLYCHYGELDNHCWHYPYFP